MALDLTDMAVVNMAIKRKIRMARESLAVTIPSQIAQLHDINEGDYLEFTPIGYGEFKIKKNPIIKPPLLKRFSP